MFKNRLEKNFKKLRPWAERHHIEAYRLYDRDIPEYPFIVDRYGDHFLVYDKSDSIIDRDKNHFPEVVEALEALFHPDPKKVIFKERKRQEGTQQYERLSQMKSTFSVQETQAKLLVNLQDYLDTGLFLDHRPMRQKIFKQSSGKRFLNLFCYTASVSVFAALGGAHTTSVDMSKNYLEWAEDNFKLNNLNPEEHRFVAMNALEYLNLPFSEDPFDLIFLDPPTFSNSKKMEAHFEVEKDQTFLVESCMKRLTESGVLYFSNNKRKFKLDPILSGQYSVRDITKDTIPVDFHDQKIHSCYEIRNK